MLSSVAEEACSSMVQLMDLWWRQGSFLDRVEEVEWPKGRFEMAVAGRSYIGISSMTYVAAGHTKEKEDDDAMVMVNGDDLLE